MKKTKLKKVIIGVSGVGIVGAGSGVASAMAATVSKEIKLVTQELWWSRGQFYSAFQDYREALADFTTEWEEGTNQAVLKEDFTNTHRLWFKFCSNHSTQLRRTSGQKQKKIIYSKKRCFCSWCGDKPRNNFRPWRIMRRQLRWQN